MSAIVQTAAVQKGVPYRTVPEVTVMLGDGSREKSTKLLFLEVKAYKSTRPAKEPEPFLVAAYGVKELAPAATAAPEPAAPLAGEIPLEQARPHHGRSFPERGTSGVGYCTGLQEVLAEADRHQLLCPLTSCFS